MKSKKLGKVLGILLTFILIITNFLGTAPIKTVYAETSQSLLPITEGFDNGTTAPIGWTFTKISGTYTSKDSCGAKSPSLKFGSSQDSIMTPMFSNPDKLTFWIKGQGTDSNSSLKAEQYDGTVWSIIDEIKPLPASGTTKEYKLNSSTIQVRFSYTKGAGNLAFDDVAITPAQNTPLPVESISLNKSELSLAVGQSETLLPVITPSNAANRNVLWASSDASVASVTNGKVEALKEGTAVITVKTDDGGFTDTCIVTVPAIHNISISEARSKAKGETVSVNGVVTFIDTTSGGTNYYIQDDTAGIDVFSKAASLNIGDNISVTGSISDYKGLLEISSSPENISVISSGNPLPAPKVITIADANGEQYESQLVKIKNVTIGKVNTSGNTEISDGINKINIYKIPALTGINAGDTVNVTAVVSQYTSYQLRVRLVSDVEKVEPADSIAPVISHTPVTSGNTGEDIQIKAVITDNKSVLSAKLYYRAKGDTQYKSIGMSSTNTSDEYTAIIPKAELNVKGLEYYIEAADGASNTSTFPADISSPIVVTVSSEDITAPSVTDLMPSSGVYTGSDLRPAISAKYNDASGIDTSSIRLRLDSSDITSKSIVTESSISYTPDADLTAGEHNVTLEVSDNSPKKNKEITTWNFNVGEQKFNLYFGQLHSHTSLSDGTGTPDDAYTWARDNGKVDFFAITDHSNSFDNDKDSENITDFNNSTSNKWKTLRKTADKYNVDGKFAAIGGYEMTWSGSTGGWGHINTFNTPWFASRNNSNMDLKSYYNKLGQNKDSISQLNHPGTTFGDFNDFGFWTQAADAVVDLIEVGNGEGAVRSSGYFPSYDYYTRALDKGWHVAPSNNQDNHKGGWITANDARTVVLSAQLTRDSIYDAIRHRRVYATEDKNLKVLYTVNNQPMGSILKNPESLNVKIDIDDPDTNDVIGKVSIISNGGKIIDTKTFTSNTADWSLTLSPQYSYYYVRIDEADKDIAVTAPVWTGEVIPVGISKVDVSQNPQVVNTPTDITATVYNNGTTLLQNVRVEFFRDSITTENKIGEQVISAVDPSSSSTAKITWTPDKTGNIKLYAQTIINIGGTDKSFTESTTITVAKSEDIIKVVIDGGHQNQYVTGDYAGKMLTLSSMLKGKNIMLVQNNDELTSGDLESAKLLIITDPQSKDDPKYNLKKSNFSDEEIKVIKGFIDNGGSLIITSRADYNDKGVTDPSYQSSAQGNRILNAIGSNLLFNDDEVVDNTSNGGQNYRLYFDDYTSSKYNLTNNITPGLTYSAYSGCSLLLKPGGNDAKVDWLVKGHDTTEILDSDGQNDATPVNKGQVNSLAAEILQNGSKIVVAGTTFFSDFETASGDNAYSNKQITENVISWMTAPSPAQVKKIAEVRVDSDKNGIPDLMGKKYAVEGVVTAQSVGVGTNNAFFDVIYVQDETGGLTIFGVSSRPIPLGTKVRVTGTVSQYEGDSQIQIKDENSDIEILDSNPVPVEPKPMKTGDSMLDENEGWLVKVHGTVKSIGTNNGDNSLYIDDGSGVAKVYVNGYVGDGTQNSGKVGKWDPSIKVGDNVSAVGLASQDASGHRVRVRNTAEITSVNVPATGIKLDKSIMIVKPGSSKVLKATVLPDTATNKNIIWKSSANWVASVDKNGLVTGRFFGITVITASTEDGNYKARCVVIVSWLLSKEFKLNKSSITMKLNNKENLKPIIGSGNKDMKDLIWSCDNSIISISENNSKDVTISALSAGKATVTAASSDGKYTATCEITVTP